MKIIQSQSIRMMGLMLILVMSFTTQSAIQVFEFDDPKLEKRFNHLIYILRCPKCQNQNLTDSDSELSQDLKQIIFEKLQAGESDQQILAFMKQRYGEFILFDPELSQENAVLWAAPGIFLFLTVFIFLFWYKNSRASLLKGDKSGETDD